MGLAVHHPAQPMFWNIDAGAVSYTFTPGGKGVQTMEHRNNAAGSAPRPAPERSFGLGVHPMVPLQNRQQQVDGAAYDADDEVQMSA